MRAKGEGTVQRVGKKWRGVLTVQGARFFGPLTTEKSQALALARLRLEKESIERQSFSTYLIGWIERQRLSPTTRSLYRTIHRSKVEPDALGGIDTQGITQRDLQAFRSRLKGSQASIANTLTLVHAALKSAGNPSRITVPSKKAKPKAILTPEERMRLLSYEGAEPEMLLIRLAMLCGLRRSELCGLKHEDREGDGINVSRAVVAADGALYVKGTKTPASESWVPLVGDYLLSRIGKGKGFVLGGDEPMDPLQASRMWEAIREKVGVDCGLHGLRRTYGMTLLESGVDVRTAADLMRHDPVMLLREYARSRKDLKGEAVKRAFGSD